MASFTIVYRYNNTSLLQYFERSQYFFFKHGILATRVTAPTMVGIGKRESRE